MSLDWQAKSACKDKDTNDWFDNYEKDTKTAKKTDTICLSCLVRKECLNYALEKNSTLTTGVFGAVYFHMGKWSKTKNKHKSKELVTQLQQEIAEIENGK